MYDYHVMIKSLSQGFKLIHDLYANKVFRNSSFMCMLFSYLSVLCMPVSTYDNAHLNTVSKVARLITGHTFRLFPSAPRVLIFRCVKMNKSENMNKHRGFRYLSLLRKKKTIMTYPMKLEV